MLCQCQYFFIVVNNEKKRPRIELEPITVQLLDQCTVPWYRKNTSVICGIQISECSIHVGDVMKVGSQATKGMCNNVSTAAITQGEKVNLLIPHKSLSMNT